MQFSFKLLNIKCNKVLSGEDSPWRERDGIRVFFLAFTGSGYRHLRVSDREYPPPDMVENYGFVPGKTLDLAFFPAMNFPDWEMPIVNVGETDKVSIAVIGLNEGLPYLSGGGGFGTGNRATIEGTEELLKTMAEKAAEAKLKGADLVTEAMVAQLPATNRHFPWYPF